MKKILILLLVVLITTGCDFNSDSYEDEETQLGTCPPDCISGSQALDIGVTYPSEGSNVYSNYPFIVQVDINDVGEIGTDGMVLVSGLDSEVFTGLSGCTPLDFYITQEDSHSDYFKEAKVEFPQSNVGIVEDDYEETLSVITRYEYKNYGIFDFCLTDDPAAETECNGDFEKNRLSKSSSGPLQIDTITQEIIPVSGDTISIIVNIKARINLDRNQQLMPVDDLTSIDCLYINEDEKIKVESDVILLGERYICDFLEFEYGENEAQVQCRIENVDLGSFVGGHKEQEGWVELKYGIEEKQSVKFNVKA